jgi:hypothetical protein
MRDLQTTFVELDATSSKNTLPQQIGSEGFTDG